MEQLEGTVTISLRDYHRILEDKAYAKQSWNKLNEIRQHISQFINIIYNNHDITSEISEFNRINKNAKVIHGNDNKIMIKIIKDGDKEAKSTDK